MALKMLTKPVTEVEPPVTETLVLPKAWVEQPKATETETLTAEYLELYKKFEYFEVKAMVKRMDEIRKQLHSIANETMDEKQPAIFACPDGEMEFSERGKVTEIPNPLALISDVLKKFGPQVASSIIDIAITPLRKVLSEYELKPYVSEQPGHRILKSVRPAK